MRVDAEPVRPAVRPETEQVLHLRRIEPGIDITRPDIGTAREQPPLLQCELRLWLAVGTGVGEEDGQLVEPLAGRGRDARPDDEAKHEPRGHPHEALPTPEQGAGSAGREIGSGWLSWGQQSPGIRREGAG